MGINKQFNKKYPFVWVAIFPGHWWIIFYRKTYTSYYAGRSNSIPILSITWFNKRLKIEFGNKIN